MRSEVKDMSQPKGQDREATEVPETGKKPYQKPAFRFERVFETRALSCGKVSATQEQCQTSLKTS